MTPATPTSRRLSDLPLWRLIIALDDAERVSGPTSATARTLARELQARLRKHDQQVDPPDGREGVRSGS